MLARILGSTHWLDRCVISAASMLRGLGFKIHWNPNISLCFFPEEPQDRSSQSNTNMIPCAARTGRSICRGYIRTVYGSSSWRILKASYAELAHLAFICQSYSISFYEQPGCHWYPACIFGQEEAVCAILSTKRHYGYLWILFESRYIFVNNSSKLLEIISKRWPP